MSQTDSFSRRFELPDIPEGPGLCILEDAGGQVLQVVMSQNIRRRIGQIFDSWGRTCVHGPKVYRAQREGQRIFVRWKLTPDYKEQKRTLMDVLEPQWAP